MTESNDEIAMKKTFDIQGCVAFVTGANKKDGMGRAFVDALVLGGANKVYATARNVSQLDELVESSNGKVIAVSLDVTDKDAISKLGTQYPDVDLVINNSGHGYGGNSLTLDPENAMKEMEINYFGPMRIIQSFKANLQRGSGENDDEKKKNSGSCSAALVNNASINSFLQNPMATGYGCSKAAVHYLTDALRRDLGENTLVIGVYPGAIDTDMLAKYDGFEKLAPVSVAVELLDALKEGKEHIFPASKKYINMVLEQYNKDLKQEE